MEGEAADTGGDFAVGDVGDAGLFVWVFDVVLLASGADTVMVGLEASVDDADVVDAVGAGVLVFGGDAVASDTDSDFVSGLGFDTDSDVDPLSAGSGFDSVFVVGNTCDTTDSGSDFETVDTGSDSEGNEGMSAFDSVAFSSGGSVETGGSVSDFDTSV